MTDAKWQDSYDISLFLLVTTLLRNRWRIVRWMLIGAVIAAASALLKPTFYQAEASFVPQGSDANVSRLANLAGQFGVTMSTGNEAYSSDFYESLLSSDVLLGEIARDTFEVPEEGGERRSFMELFEIPPGTPGLREELAIRASRTMIRSSVDRNTSVVEY